MPRDADRRGQVRTAQNSLEITPQTRRDNGVTATVQLDASNRIILSRDLRRAAGIARRQKLKISAGPGRIVTGNPSHFAHTAPELQILTP
jgi:hypothetical protein